MSKVRVSAFSISLDGYGAGPNQNLENPLGEGGPKLHEWFYPTRTFQKQVLGKGGGATGPEDDLAARAMQNVGAWILGRNMFTPGRGAWDETWKGWWGPSPPYHCDVFVLTHHARKPLEMEGGTTFYFVTDGMHAALERARASAKDKDVRIGGGANTIRQYLSAGLIDEMHLAVSPVILGAGENLLAGISLAALGFTQVEYVGTEKAAHYILRKQK